MGRAEAVATAFYVEAVCTIRQHIIWRETAQTMQKLYKKRHLHPVCCLAGSSVGAGCYCTWLKFIVVLGGMRTEELWTFW